MRRYRSGPLAWGASATREYARPESAEGVCAQITTAPQGRECPVCGARLSIYNPDELCGACELRAGQPLSPEALGLIFEAVCAALNMDALYEELMKAAP
jgi:hypothetical protein